MKLFEDIRLDYCSLHTLQVDKMYGKERYKFLARIPATKQNIEALKQEVIDSVAYAKANKLAIGKYKQDPRTPFSIEKYLSKDGETLNVNIDSKQPFVLYDQYGDKIANFEGKTIHHADIQLFAYVWTMNTDWGVKLCCKAIRARTTLDQLQANEAEVGACGFKFEPKSAPKAGACPWD